ncbi:MAG: hypothetical protein CMG69_03885 [Candidatus Marinimicrobia bacterium]|nr:hypothetical protein [Candidatus Neomarinimicrobiota bacterium]
MNFLINTQTDWDEPPRARHQLARALAIDHHVIFVSKNKYGTPRINISNPEKNITILSPFWYIKGKFTFRIPIINEIYQHWLFKKLKIKYRDYILINFDPTASLLHKYFNKIIYLCNDDFLSKKRSKSVIISIYWYFKQRQLIKEALFCTGVSRYLHNYLLKYNKNSHLMLTGASFLNQKNITYKVIEKNKNINIVYVGWLNKLNVKWIEYISQNKKYNIYLIGPGLSKTMKPLKKNDNIVFTGELIGNELREMMEKANIFIAPYYKDKDTEKVYTMPNKFWLYLSYGKPIVTCRINNLAKLPEKFVYQSKDEKEFITNIDKAIKEYSETNFEKKLNFISQNTWDNRVDKLLEYYHKYDAS